LLIGAIVRADAPPGRYVVDARMETVKDTRTQLTWQREPAPGSYEWEPAGAYCASLTLAGLRWRLPSVKEVLSLVDPTRYNPSSDPTAFPADNTLLWTATKTRRNAAKAWYVSFETGFLASSELTSQLYVRCVQAN
jgi:hypothetical protein